MPILRDRGIYQFSILMRTPFAGLLVIARAEGDGFDLFTAEEWGTLAPSRIRVDVAGRVLFHGRTTGYRSDVLIDSGESVTGS
jgi:hypothetical protein